jgi:hypothetical protein
MAKSKDLLRDKLSALNPGVPTNTRGETARQREAQSPPDADADTRGKTAAAANMKMAFKSDIKIESRQKPEAASGDGLGPKPVPKADFNDTPQEEERPAFGCALVIPALFHEHVASLGRIQEAMVAEAGNMQRFYLRNWLQGMETCFETTRRTCTLFPPFLNWKWPFIK